MTSALNVLRWTGAVALLVGFVWWLVSAYQELFVELARGTM
jgi:hypothetical protein